MRPTRFSTVLMCGVWLLVGAFSHAQTVTHVQATEQGFLIVQVSINGSGPYSFFLDTGSNRTMVRNEVLEKLGIASGLTVPVHMATGVIYVHQAVVSSVVVAGLAVHDLEVEGLDAGELSGFKGSFQGVLGEDFLKHFDVLIDNQAKTLSLDETTDLANSLAGDHLPLWFSGTRGGHSTTDRLMCNLKTSTSDDTSRILIDSGANYTMFFPTKPLPIPSGAKPGGTLKTLSGSGRCFTSVLPLELGRVTLPAATVAFCEGMRGNTDVDGVLPTSTFKRLFISHSGAYAIANPRLRKPSPSLLSTASSGK